MVGLLPEICRYSAGLVSFIPTRSELSIVIATALLLSVIPETPASAQVNPPELPDCFC